MRTRVVFVGVLFVLATFGAMPAFAQDDEVRGAFMTTRPKTSSKPKPGPARKPNRRRPKAITGGGNVTTPAPTGGTSKATAQRIGMGLTLFMRDSNGMAVRTDPSREFKNGDRVRVLLETNADGYLYIFNTTDGGQPELIYPAPELDEAGNYIQAHVPFEIPSSVAPEERLRWFAFDQNPGTEKVYFVFSREPLAGVPIEDDLITFCRDNKPKCPWTPSTEVWAQIQTELNAPTQVARASSFGKTQTSSESDAVARGLGLNRDDPEPSLIMLTASTDKKVLIATLDLIHKAVSVVGN
ncbi:MAG: DUF4384 domain-containing protein [Acidobacteriota bacterium]|nr:DUF4384 domain-containing protein [Acidobacteriota bacterium]